MSEKEMNAYRLEIGQEPIGEILEQIMKEVAQEARESSAKAIDFHFKQMFQNNAAKREFGAQRINHIING